MKPSKIFCHDVIVQAAIQDTVTSFMDNENNLDYFTSLIIINKQGMYGICYRTDIILATLVTDHGWNKHNYLKLATTDKSPCLTGEYTVHSYNFDYEYSYM